MYTHSPDPSKQYAILRKIRGSRDQAIPGYFAPQEYPGYEVDVAKATFFLHINEQKHHIVKIFRCKMEKSARVNLSIFLRRRFFEFM